LSRAVTLRLGAVPEKPCTGTSIATCAWGATENGTSVALRGPLEPCDHASLASTDNVPRSTSLPRLSSRTCTLIQPSTVGEPAPSSGSRSRLSAGGAAWARDAQQSSVNNAPMRSARSGSRCESST
jgi:hypothetical protein